MKLRLWLWTGLGLCAVVFWSMRLACQPFAEPPQIAVVGHDAPWRAKTRGAAVLSVGTDRRTNDIVLYDRKASPVHFELERRGSQGNWWALLRNRSAERGIEVRRGESPRRRIRVNRFRLRHNDRFFVPLYAKTNRAAERPKDSCSPSSVHRWLQQRSPTPPPVAASRSTSLGVTSPQPYARKKAPLSKPKAWVALQINRRRLDLSLRPHHAQMTWGKGASKRLLWLEQTRRFAIPPQAGGGFLEYRYNQWQIQRKNRWTPFTQPLQWGKPLRKVLLVRRPRLSTKPLYQIGLASSPCRWTLTPQSIPAGLAIGRIARLHFKGSQLVLQHLGREPLPIQVVPSGRQARHLGSTPVRTGDYISVGQLTYRITIQKDRVRLMLARTPQRYALPLRFFGNYPSEQITMRHWIRPKSRLLLTGGEGSQSSTQRWRIPLSTAGSEGQTRVSSPYAPFFVLQHIQRDQYNISPVSGLTIYTASPQGNFQKKRITKPTRIKAGAQLYYIQRLYLRIFQPSYHGLSWRIALLWLLVAGGAVLFMHWLVRTGRLLLAPLMPTSQHLAQASSLPTSRGGLAFLWLWPAALFLNGLGLYILATLSLSSLGLNNNSFLYRQLLWSLVGVVLFVAWVAGVEKQWAPALATIQKLIPKGVLNLWQRLFPPAAPGVQLLSHTPPPSVSPKLWLSLTLLYFAACFLVGLVFQAMSLLLPTLVLYLYVVAITWEYRRNRFDSEKLRSLRYFFLTLLLLGIVPLVGLLLPPLVHNRFFLKVPGLGTVKASDFAILSAIVFFAHYLGQEVFALQRNQMNREHQTEQQEASHSVQRRERLSGAVLIGLLYLLLLGAIGTLYTVQGDLGPGLILTCCFSLFLLFAFLTTGADRLTTIGNLIRIAIVFLGFLILFWLPDIIGALFPEWAAQSSELQKVQERLALWNQPWRFVVGEQILQNLWNLAGHHGAFQWFNNLHSDFVLTAVIRILSPTWGYLLIGLTCLFPISSLLLARRYWTNPSPTDSAAVLQQHQQNTIRALLILFGGIYLFAQNLIHVGSVLRITPMTGVTFTWVSSGGTSLIVCYLVLGLIHRQLRVPESP